jgi:hypothetical protein
MRAHEQFLLSVRYFNHAPANVWVSQSREYLVSYAKVRVADVRRLASLGKVKRELPKGSGRHGATLNPGGASRTALYGLMKVVAEPVRRHNEEHLKSLAIALIDPPVGGLDTIGFQLSPDIVDA